MMLQENIAEKKLARNKEEYLLIIDKYDEILKGMPALIQNSSETLYEIADKVSLSNSTVSNKIHGRRAWRHEDIKKVVNLIGTPQQQETVEKYWCIVQDIMPIIHDNGYKYGFIFEKAGLTHMQYQVRNRSLSVGRRSVWEVDEVRRVINVLRF